MLDFERCRDAMHRVSTAMILKMTFLASMVQYFILRFLFTRKRLLIIEIRIFNILEK